MLDEKFVPMDPTYSKSLLMACRRWGTITDKYMHRNGPLLPTWPLSTQSGEYNMTLSNYAHYKMWGEIAHPFSNFTVDT